MSWISFCHILCSNFCQNAIMAFCLMWWMDLHPSTSVVRRHHSSITKWSARTSRERFDPVSPNFIWTSILTHSTATLNMTSLATSGGMIPRKHCWKCCFRRLWVKFLQKGSSEILHTYHVRSQTCWIWRQLSASFRLQNAINYCTKVCKTCAKESNDSATV